MCSTSVELDNVFQVNQNVLLPKRPMFSPKIFSGRLGESVQEFLNTFCLACEVNNWSHDDKVRFLPCYLADTALSWYSNNITEWNTWDQIALKLTTDFKDPAEILILKNKLKHRIFNPLNELSIAYVTDIIKMCYFIDKNMSDHQIKEHILDGLPPDILEQVLLLGDNTVQDVSKNIKKVTEIKKWVQISTVEFNKKYNLLMIRNCSDKIVNNNIDSMIKNEKSESIKTLLCSNCNCSDHSSEFCTFISRCRENSFNKYCRICKKSNHVTRNCYLNKSYRRSNSHLNAPKVSHRYYIKPRHVNIHHREHHNNRNHNSHNHNNNSQAEPVTCFNSTICTGTLLRHNSNTLVNYLFDTGSTLTFISAKLVSPSSIFPRPNLTCKSAGNQKLQILGESEVSFKLNEQDFRHNAIVVKDLVQDLILGVDFMEKYQVIIDYENGTVTGRVNGIQISLSENKEKYQNSIKYQTHNNVDQILGPQNNQESSLKVPKLKKLNGKFIGKGLITQESNTSKRSKIDDSEVGKEFKDYLRQRKRLLKKDATHNNLEAKLGNNDQKQKDRKNRFVKVQTDCVIPPKSSAIVKLSQKIKGNLIPNKNNIEDRCLVIVNNQQEDNLEVFNPSRSWKYLYTNDIVGIIKNTADTDFSVNNLDLAQTMSCFNVMETYEIVNTDIIRSKNLNLSNNFTDLGGNVIEIGKNLSSQQQFEVRTLLNKYINCFATSSYDFGPDNKLTPYKIEIEEGDKPVNIPPYKLGLKESEILDQIVDELYQAGIIEPSNSEYSSPVFVVPKKDGLDKTQASSYRLVCNFQKVNKLITKENFVIPRVDLILDTMAENKLWSTMDINSAFFNQPLAKESRKYTAFKTKRNNWQFKFLPFGMVSSSEAFAREMTRIFNFLLWRHIIIYIDDIVAFSKTFEQHLDILEQVFQKLEEFGLKVKSSKCKFFQTEIKLLGHVVNETGTMPDPRNLDAIKIIKPPSKQKEIRSFLGSVSYFRRYIQNFSKISAPLVELTKKEYERKIITLNEEQMKSFQTLKDALMSPPILEYFNQNRKTIVVCDSCSDSIAGVLMQIGADNDKHVIAYVSRKLTSTEKRYSATELELLGMVFIINYFKNYLHFLDHFEVHTDHKPLVSIIHNQKDNIHRLQRLLCKLIDFNFTVKHVSGKSITLIDYLSRNSTEIVYEKELIEIDTCCNIIITNIHKAQLEDEFLSKIYQGLTNPDSVDKKIFHQLRQYELDENNIIQYKNYTKDRKQLLLAIPRKMVKQVLTSYHDHPYNGAHLGIKKCYESIKNKYNWKGMLQDITDYINSCVSCGQRKIPRAKTAGFLQPIPLEPVEMKPMSDLCIDFVGPLPPSEGKKYILVCTDAITRYVVVKASSEATAKVTVEFLKDIITTFGCPTTVRSDRGTHFNNELVKGLTKALNIKYLFSTSYRPQTQGRTEKFNNTLIDSLSHYVNETGRNWTKYLKACVFAYNCSKHESLQYAPFYLLYGFQPTQVDELQIVPANLKYDIIESIEILGKVRREMPKVLSKAQEKQKKYYDVNKKHVEFFPNDLVMVKIPNIRDKGNKFQSNFKGPYRIIKKLSDLTYLVKIEKNNRLVDEKIHIEKLKRFSARKNFEE